MTYTPITLTVHHVHNFTRGECTGEDCYVTESEASEDIEAIDGEEV